MEDSRVAVQISIKEKNVFSDNSRPVRQNDLQDLIAILKETQQKTNECLTELTQKSAGIIFSADKSDDSDDDGDSEDCCIVAEDENDRSPKRAKFKK